MKTVYVLQWYPDESLISAFFKKNDNTLTGCLYRLSKQGLIKTVVSGKGRTPSKYIVSKKESLYD